MLRHVPLRRPCSRLLVHWLYIRSPWRLVGFSSCWMLFLSRLFSSQTFRLLRSLPRTPPPRPQLTTRFTPFSISRSLHTSMPASAHVVSQNAKPLETHGNFDLVKRFKLNFADIHVSKWKSRTSGLSVVHLDYDGAFYTR